MTSSIPTADEINSLTEQEFKVLENRLRRAAARQGLKLEKSRARDPRALGFGTYRLVDVHTNTIAAGGYIGGYGMELEDVAGELLS
jgi:hypothetical protein